MSILFKGDNKALISSITALLALDAKGALSPHGIGEMARDLLETCAARLPAQHQGEPVALPERKRGLTDNGTALLENLSWNACLDEIAKLGPLFSRPVQEEGVGLPCDWETQLLDEMSTRFELNKHDDGHMVVDDTQIGVEFAAEWVKQRVSTHPVPSVQQGEPVAFEVDVSGYTILLAKTADKAEKTAQHYRTLSHTVDIRPLYTHPDAGEVERLRYKADLYDEVWELATGLGYMNVTTAISSLRADLGSVKSSRDAFGQNALDLRAEVERERKLRRDIVARLRQQKDESRAEVDALRDQVAKQACVFCNDSGNLMAENETLRAQLAERDALLQSASKLGKAIWKCGLQMGGEQYPNAHNCIDLAQRIDAALSASAEPTPFPGYPPVPEDRKLPAEPSAPVERTAFEAAWSLRRRELKINERGNEFYRVQPNDLVPLAQRSECVGDVASPRRPGAQTMTVRKLAYCCLTGSLMWLCLIGGAWLATAHAEHQPEPVRTQAPAGDQFNEGPVLVRLPSAHLSTTRYIF